MTLKNAFKGFAMIKKRNGHGKSKFCKRNK